MLTYKELFLVLLYLVHYLDYVQPESSARPVFLSLNISSYNETLQNRYEGEDCQCRVMETEDLTENYTIDNCLNEESADLEPAGLCTSVLGSLKYDVTQRNTNNTGVYTSRLDLCEDLEMIKRRLLQFQNILDRTLCKVYSLSCRSKSLCLNAYKKWLCTTQLSLYMNNSTEEIMYVQDSNGSVYIRVKPCLTVCEEVLQECPYYLPSPYQSDSVLSNATVYGGYPAFACPAKPNMSRGSYFPTGMCIGGVSSVHSQSTVMWLMLLSVVATLIR